MSIVPLLHSRPLQTLMSLQPLMYRLSPSARPPPCPDDFLAGEEEGGDDGIGADPGKRSALHGSRCPLSGH